MFCNICGSSVQPLVWVQDKLDSQSLTYIFLVETSGASMPGNSIPKRYFTYEVDEYSSVYMLCAVSVGYNGVAAYITHMSPSFKIPYILGQARYLTFNSISV